MTITTKGRYALRALARLATYDQCRPISLHELAETEDISPQYLEQLFFRLRRAGIVRSIKGPGGGFLLARGPAEISLSQIFEAVGENGKPRREAAREPDFSGAAVERSATHAVWAQFEQPVHEYFSGISLKTLVDADQVDDRTAIG